MSYSVRFNPPKEAIEKYREESKSWFSCMKRYRMEVIVTVLQDNSKKSVSDIVWAIDSDLRGIAHEIKMEKYKNVIDQFESDGHVVYWGNEWANDEPNWTVDEALDHFSEKLIILAKVVDTPDYFDKGEDFYQKWNEVKSELECFEEAVIEAVVYDIMADLKDYQDKPDYNF